MISREQSLAPAAIAVIAAAAKEKHNYENDQQEFHNILQNMNFRGVS